MTAFVSTSENGQVVAILVATRLSPYSCRDVRGGKSDAYMKVEINHMTKADIFSKIILFQIDETRPKIFPKS